MLGIRHYKKHAIDLWCGPVSEFASDFVASDIGEGFVKAGAEHARHLVLDDSMADLDAPATMQKIKSIIDEHPASNPKRISVVCENLDRYYEWQDQLFKTFPEL